MTATVQQRALDILEASLALPKAEQAGFLVTAARDDAALAAELRRLEPARQRTGQFLTVGEGGVLPAELPPPERIGPFRLGRLLGRGGMGSVYEGERDDGLFEQSVAIKLLSIRHQSKELEASLASERRILARLEHRNIARLLDGGQTPDGRSFIVMERIDGEPITEYAARHALGLEERIRLFAQLTAALQYAHQQLVVHADLKPSNILVARDGSVKLLDFGIAALLDRDPGSDAAVAGARPVTRAYAPPERTAGAEPTVVGDVYGAGVVLRELLSATGRPWPADLESVLRTATAPDPAARYGSVVELREDLERWLARRPVSVHHGGWAYPAGRFVVRNRLGVSLMAIIVAGLGLATAISTVLLLRAERASAESNRRLDQVVELNSLLVDDLSYQFANRPGMAGANWRILADALQRLDALAADRPDDVRLQVVLARNLVQLAAVSGAAHRAGLAARLEATARRLATLAVTAGSPLVADWLAVRADVAGSRSVTAIQVSGDAESARRLAGEATQHARGALRHAPDSHASRTAMMFATLAEAGALNAGGRPRAALAVLDALPRVARRAGAPDATTLRHDTLLTEAQYLRCDIQRWLLANAESLRSCLDTVELLRRTIAARGRLVYFENRLAYTLFLAASQLQMQGENARALAMLDEARGLYARILYFGDDDEMAGSALVVESAHAAALTAVGRLAEARSSAATLLQARLARLAAAPGTHARERELAMALRRVGEVELVAGDQTRACRAFADAGAIWDRQEREGRLLAFDRAPTSGQVPWIRAQLRRCP